MTCRLSVNVNAVAYLRNRREVPWPSVTGIARIALEAGADGITVHPRPDERHIRRADVPELAELVASFDGREFCIEGNPDARFVELVEAIRPTQVLLVPDDIRQVTSDHGWDIALHRSFLTDIVQRLKEAGMRVSLFVDPEPHLPGLAAEVGADRIEVYTGPYGSAFEPARREREFARLVAAGNAARKAGVGLNAGHDLTRENLPPLVEALPHLAEVSIGHAFFADAFVFGTAKTVEAFRTACRGEAAS